VYTDPNEGVTPYFFAHILAIEILTLALALALVLALVVNPKTRGQSTYIWSPTKEDYGGISEQEQD
jgi:hypothetical protein